MPNDSGLSVEMGQTGSSYRCDEFSNEKLESVSLFIY